MAYKVLLIDDEVIDLEWLKRRVAWSELGLEVTATANSGFAAMRIIKEQHFDIVLSDIKMPIMSGLELAKKAREVLPDLKVAFISGHEDFEYAKKAIAVNAYGYILKPINDAELLELLKSMVQRLDEENQVKNEKSKLKETFSLLKDELVYQWLEGKKGYIDPPVMDEYGLPSESINAIAAVIEIDDINWKLNQYPEDQRKKLLADLGAEVIKFFKFFSKGYYYWDNNCRVIILIGGFDTDELQSLLLTLIEHVKKNFPLTITVGMGQEYFSIEDLKISYKQAVEALQYKMFTGKSRIITAEFTKGKVVESAINLEEKLEALFNSMLCYDLVGIVDRLEELFIFVKNMKTIITVYNFTVHIITKLDALLQKSNENLYELLGLELKDLDVLFRFETIDDIHSWLRRKLFELSELIMLKKQKQDRKIIDEIKKYVCDHLENKLTLREVADHFGFSPNYLGHIFKEDTGENFSDFLVRMRLEKACKYLLNPKMKVYEIIELVGHKNVIYFNRQFKDYYGFTPSDFRKRNKV